MAGGAALAKDVDQEVATTEYADTHTAAGVDFDRQAFLDAEANQIAPEIRVSTVSPFKKYTVEQSDGVWSIARGIDQLKLFPDGDVPARVNELREFLTENQPEIDLNNLKPGDVIDVPAFLRQEFVKRLDMEGQFEFQQGQGLFTAARLAFASGQFNDTSLGGVVRKLEAFIEINHPDIEDPNTPALYDRIDLAKFARTKGEIEPEYSLPHTHTVQGGENLWIIMKHYKDELPMTDEYAALRDVPTQHLVKAAELSRGHSGHLQQGEVLELDKIFNMSAVEAGRAALSQQAQEKRGTRGRELPANYLSESELNRAVADARRELRRDGIDMPALILKELARHESDYDAHAMGKKGDRGLCQIRDIAAKEVWPARFGEYDPMKLYKPEINLYIAGAYLRKQWKAMGNPLDGLAAYNRGIKGWSREREGSSDPDNAALKISYVRGVLEDSPELRKSLGVRNWRESGSGVSWTRR